jgi:hypothetical protein
MKKGSEFKPIGVHVMKVLLGPQTLGFERKEKKISNENTGFVGTDKLKTSK